MDTYIFKVPVFTKQAKYPVYGMDTYIFKVPVFTKQAKYE